MPGTKNGKAFEYACAEALLRKYEGHADITGSPQLDTAKADFDHLPVEEKDRYALAADAGARTIDKLEPRLSEPFSISLQPDAAGMRGDVRDVLCMDGGGWEVGISCKHNHDAVKHSRLSDSIDFGEKWFGKACSEEYFNNARAIFGQLRELRDDTRDTHPALWREMDDKEGEYYAPVLTAFMEELRRLDAAYPREIPEMLVRYLVGRNDFYKVIMDERGEYTEVEAVNINGTLNQPCGRRRAVVNVPVLRMPTQFYEIGFKDGSRGTAVIVCDEGWNFSMRIHNASERVEPSLKFDVRLMAMPGAMLSQIEPWH